MQTYSALIFTYYGMTTHSALLFSVFYPILQLIPVMVSTRVNISRFNEKHLLLKKLIFRRILILGGYFISIKIQFFLIITSSYPYLPPNHQMIAMTVLLLILSISFTFPCNTALCILFEQFDGANVKVASKSRCVMWFLASIRFLHHSMKKRVLRRFLKKN